MIDLRELLAGVLLFGSSLFLILLVLVQRGRGGGLTGALGGMGGQSAFGAKAGDLFTRITVITASIWILLCMLTISFLNPPAIPVKKTTTSAEAGAEESTEGDESGSIGSGEDITPGGDTSEDETEQPKVPVGPELPSGG